MGQALMHGSLCCLGRFCPQSGCCHACNAQEGKLLGARVGRDSQSPGPKALTAWGLEAVSGLGSGLGLGLISGPLSKFTAA